MGVSCQILINKPGRGIHKPGKPVTGIVKYIVDEPSNYKDILISLIGKGNCSWQEHRRNVHTRRNETVTYTGKEVYTAQHISLHEKGPEGIFLLPAGIYERPFNFVLPYNIPSSFKNKTCIIKYKIELKFDKPGLCCVANKFDTEIDVIGYVTPVTPERTIVTELKKSLFRPFAKRKHHIKLETDISNSIFRPGELITLHYKVTNDSDVIVPSLKAELVCHLVYTADCGRKKERTKVIEECTIETPSVPDNAVAAMTNAMQLTALHYTIQNSRIFFNEYSIRVTLRLPMPHINASLKIPIVIGEKYGDDEEIFELAEACSSREEPPSYYQVMSEDKGIIDKNY